MAPRDMSLVDELTAKLAAAEATTKEWRDKYEDEVIAHAETMAEQEGHDACEQLMFKRMEAAEAEVERLKRFVDWVAKCFGDQLGDWSDRDDFWTGVELILGKDVRAKYDAEAKHGS